VRRAAPTTGGETRAQIKALAQDLLIQRGYRGVSFGDLAEALNTTRANIHYHFGTKQKLIEEVLADYVRKTTDDLREIWTAPDTPLMGRIEAMLEYSRVRYAKYNAPGKAGRPWSLIARMRQDNDALTAKGRALLQRFGSDVTASIVAAIEQAKARGELDPATPVEDVAIQLVSIANSAGPITQDAGSFERLEQLYLAFARIVTQAFGRGRPATSLRGKPVLRRRA
jgi:TetR/AcrR family transcriptional regulator, transcriptional repressor for nem operon